MYKFDIWKDKREQYRVRFRWNDEVLFATDGYENKQSALNAIESIKRNGPEAETEDSTC